MVTSGTEATCTYLDNGTVYILPHNGEAVVSKLLPVVATHHFLRKPYLLGLDDMGWYMVELRHVGNVPNLRTHQDSFINGDVGFLPELRDAIITLACSLGVRVTAWDLHSGNWGWDGSHWLPFDPLGIEGLSYTHNVTLESVTRRLVGGIDG